MKARVLVLFIPRALDYRRGNSSSRVRTQPLLRTQRERERDERIYIVATAAAR